MLCAALARLLYFSGFTSILETVMCRNIKKLRREECAPSDAELRDAALQFVRKISGFRAPSQKNAAAFDHAVDEVARASRDLFTALSAPRRASAAGSR